jgi:hypothetical protein
MGGGGVCGKGGGIAHSIMTGAGAIMTVFRFSILTSTQGGADTLEPILGRGIDGTISGFPYNDCYKTGRAGTMIDIGNGKGRGVSKAINLDHNHRERH